MMFTKWGSWRCSTRVTRSTLTLWGSSAFEVL
jgi:hypothetical protein